ncbi:Transforming acidic coiled-coil-containing protein 2 [Mactra antiquata]
MGDEGDRPDSPPLPRGSYNINFDELDLDAIDPFKSGGGLGSSPKKDTINPFQSKSKLGSSPPIHSQPISIPSNENEHDSEEINPFQSKSKLGQSPVLNSFADNGEDPFKSKTKLGHSPPGSSDFNEEPCESSYDAPETNGIDNELEENPFHSKSKLGNSPVNEVENPFQNRSKLSSSPVNSADTMTNVTTDNSEGIEPVGESLDKSNKGFKTRSKSKTPPTTHSSNVDTTQSQSSNDVDQDGGSEISEPKPVKKMPSPKKSGIKKPKARSKFKPPPNFGVQSSEDVVIFAPPVNAQSDDNINESTTADNENDGKPADTEPVTNENSDNNIPNQMTTSEMIGRVSHMIDSVHDFGAGEMPMENNEEFVPASEAFNDEEAWDMMEKVKYENEAHVRDSLSRFDPLVDEQVPDKVTRRVSDTSLDGNSLSENEDLMLMSTPQQSKQPSSTSRGVARHPAARALQEHVDGDGAPREVHVIDKMLFSPVKGEEGKPRVEGDERYFDALEYPTSKAAQHKKKSRGETDVERMNAANRKHGTNGDSNQDNIVQLVQDSTSSNNEHQVLKYSQSDWNKMKQELDLEFNARILNKEREWSKKLADREKKISYLDEQILLLRSSNEDMKCVVTEFEKTIAQLQAEKEKSTTESQQTFEDVVKERDQALEDLQSVETAFSDLHQRYERTKGVVEGFKKNEDVLKKCVQDYQNKLKSAEDKIIAVRNQAEDKLSLASDEMDKLRKSTTAEVARLEAALKKAELKIQGVERSLEQKVQENSELTAICDELIAKVGGD